MAFLLYNLVLLLSLHIHLGLGDVIYISSSQNDCKIRYKICLTLNQLANNTVAVNNATLRLIFLPGNHTLKYDFEFFDLISFSMQGDTSLVQAESTNRMKILCQRKAKFEFVNIEYLKVEGLHFIGCGNNKFHSVKLVVIHNSTFQGHNDSGTALIISAATASINVAITKSYFTSNIVGTCMNYMLVKPMTVLAGGAIFVLCQLVSCNINIVESTFRDNSAEVGGAIALTGTNNSIVIVQSTFVGNWVVEFNESVRNSRCPSNNKTSESYHGLHSYLQHSTAKSRHTVTLTDFDHNMRYTMGGAIFIYRNSVTICSSVFTNNTSLDGVGGVFTVQGAILEIHSSVFCDNHALKAYGGIMMVSSSPHVMMENCTVHNSRSQAGGVMTVVQSYIIIKSCEFNNNSVKSNGGVIASVINTHLKIISSKFTNNKAESGGALYAVNMKCDHL